MKVSASFLLLALWFGQSTAANPDLRGTALLHQSRQVQAIGSVVTFRVIDADTNAAIANFDTNAGGAVTIDLAGLTTTTGNLNLEAITSGSVGSIEWKYDSVTRVENSVRWAFCGNAGADFFPCGELVEGFDATITATPYSGKWKNGLAGTPSSVSVKIVRSRPTLALTLMNADSDQAIGPLSDASTIRLDQTPRINVRADIPTSLSVRSVRFWYDGVLFRTENFALYAFNGNSGNDFFPFVPTVGCHNIMASAYSERDAGGLLRATATVNFCVVANTAPTSVVTPTKSPTKLPTKKPTKAPTKSPTKKPTKVPTKLPSKEPSKATTKSPTKEPTKTPTKSPTKEPTKAPTKSPTKAPTKSPTKKPTQAPTKSPTKAPIKEPTKSPTKKPTKDPTKSPTKVPTMLPLAPTKPDIIINEIMKNPFSVGDDFGEWFELYNVGPTMVNLTGWRVKDNGADSFSITSALTIQAGGFLVLARNGNTALNGGVAADYVYSNFALANSGDEIVLLDTSNNEIDSVNYSTAFPNPNGASFSLKSPFLDNSVGSNWCTSSTLFGNGDKGTPGKANDCVMPPASTKVPTSAVKAPMAPVAPGKAPTIPVMAPIDPVNSSTAPIKAPTAPVQSTTFIHDVQGSGPTVVAPNTAVTVTGIVTSIIETNDAISGFFLQEEDQDQDSDVQTSEGIFVLCNQKCISPISTGDKIAVSGIQLESFGTSQVTISSYIVISTGNGLPSPVIVTLPASGSTKAKATFANLEGMIVTFPGTLTVNEHFELARFGQVVLSADSRPFQFTHLNSPSLPGYEAHVASYATKVIILDDNSNTQNDAISPSTTNEAFFYPSGGLSITNKFRAGDTIVGLTGVMSYDFNAWRLRPIPSLYNYTFTKSNPAPLSPAAVGGNLKVSCFNVLNYFTTLATNANVCGPLSNQGCRGANTMLEFTRQRAKIVSALVQLDADIFGIVEIENAVSDAPLLDLVGALNAAIGGTIYTARLTGAIGTDVIRVALIYKHQFVSPLGPFNILESDAFDPSRNRPALIQTFQTVAGGKKLTVAVNHFKSKGSCSSAQPDSNDGQACWALARKNAAIALADHLATDPTGSNDPDFLIIGDLNAYAKEDAITELTSRGYVDLNGPTAYSYLFSGQSGYLDHALASPSLFLQVSGATQFHINADEPSLFDYNDDQSTAGEATFERKSSTLPLYAPDPYRSSDHDPVLVGFNLL